MKSLFRRAAPRTLKGRLALWHAGVVAVVLLAFCGVTYFSVLEEQDEDEASARGARETETAEVHGPRLLLGLSIGLAVALALGATGSLWIGRRALRPLDRIKVIATGLRGDDLGMRIDAQADEPEDVTRLVMAVNGMLARIEASVGGQRRFTADASHELRTPLARMIATLEVALHRPRAPAEVSSAAHEVLEDLRQLSGLVEALLTFARVDAGELPISLVDVDVADLVRRTAEPYEMIALERGLRLQVKADAAVVAHTDPLWLGRAVANLVDNAVKFAAAGAGVQVLVTVATERVRVSVENEGAPPALDERSRIFERFYRAPGARGNSVGFGLGLPLARDIARRLGGDLTLEASGAGSTRFDLEIAR